MNRLKNTCMLQLHKIEVYAQDTCVKCVTKDVAPYMVKWAVIIIYNGSHLLYEVSSSTPTMGKEWYLGIAIYPYTGPHTHPNRFIDMTALYLLIQNILCTIPLQAGVFVGAD